MKRLRTIVVIALAATGLLHFQASVAHACGDDRAQASSSSASAGHDHGHEAHEGGAPENPTNTGGTTTCPMGGLMLPCGTATAAPVTLVTIVPAPAVSSARPVVPTFLIPPSFSGSDLFHPPRA